LLACIIENESIKSGLFPGPGANISSSKGGGLTKTKNQFRLCKAMFGDEKDWRTVL
ncbi:hypothetical protein BDP27DRAFT_1235158, partial [Rhodocollybia butyracea]